MEEEIVILISNVFSPQKIILSFKRRGLKLERVLMFFASKQVLREGHSLMDLVEKHIYSTPVHFLTPCSPPSNVLLVWQ